MFYGITERVERENVKNIWKDISQTFPKPMKDIKSQIQEVLPTRRIKCTKKPTSMSNQNNLLRRQRESQRQQSKRCLLSKTYYYNGLWLFNKKYKNRKGWNDILKALKENNGQARILYQAKIFLKGEKK